jgi:energy-coupling factor transporter ATP-binding protein EcfA2
MRAGGSQPLFFPNSRYFYSSFVACTPSFLNEIIDILGLGHVQHSLIGDELRRGVSGGQRKRVNIAIELISSPLLLFLDEPTSGLDATTSQALVESLQKLTMLGLTVAMVIHQPRIELLNMIENLILLQRGGHPVYIGPTQTAMDYFSGYLGLSLPSLTSPADFYLDVITLDQKIDGEGNRLLKLKNGEDLVNCWARYAETNLKQLLAKEPEPLPLRQIPRPNRPSRLSQTHVYYIRSIRQMLNNKRTFLVDAGLLIFAGALAGFVAKNVMVGNQMVMTVNGLIGIMNALRVFGPEKAIFRREMQSGISSLAYFLGKSTSQLPLTFATPFFFLATYYRLAFPDLTFWSIYFTIVACLFSATGIGYFLSLLVEPQNAMISGVVFGLVAIMTCGLNPTLRDLESTFFGAFMCKVTYGPNIMSALFTGSAIKVFKAGVF